MLDYDVWSKPVALRSVKNWVVRLEQDSNKRTAAGMEERSFVHLNIATRPRLNRVRFYFSRTLQCAQGANFYLLFFIFFIPCLRSGWTDALREHAVPLL